MSAETASDDLVVVANRLPVHRDDEGEWSTSPGGLVSALAPVLRQRGGAWVGWGGDIDPGELPATVDDIGLRHVPLDEIELELYYEGFANGTLWPLHHDVIRPPHFHRSWWRAYRAVNRRFAEAAAEVSPPEGTVWVQDYHLELVPEMLRELRPDLTIGFFCHIPFPPVEIFVRVPWREQLLRGLLGADVIGFQLPSDARNFRRSVEQVLGLTPAPARGADHLVMGTRSIRIADFPISIDVGAVQSLAADPERVEQARMLRKELGDPEYLLLGVDRLDYTKGIDVRLRAFGEAIESGRLDDAVFVQVAVPSREGVEEYVEIRNDVEQLVGEINGAHAELGRPVANYLYRSLDFDELVTLYLAADVLVCTPLRDGMNLVAKEYVAARVDLGGAVVLSEFAGAASELPSAYQVNPYDIDAVANAIVAAATDDPDERCQRMAAMRRRVVKHDVHRWAASFLDALGA